MLLLCINISGNLGLFFLIPEQSILTMTTILLLCICYFKRIQITGIRYLLLPFCAIFFIQALYLSAYSFNTTIHYILKILMAVIVVSLCKESFARYFSSIIFIYAAISLVCYTLNSMGVVIPFFSIPHSTTLDGGHTFRVYNLFYTQLYNPLVGGGITLRNCGPFWEPGAFQGFLNLSLWFELSLPQERDVCWLVRVGVLVSAIITTFSTGGYIVLFCIISYFLFKESYVNNNALKSVAFVSCLVIFVFIYYKFGFLGSKIETDKGRLSFVFLGFENPLQMIFGYGLDVDSFSKSSIQSASSIFNLFRYFGIVGFVTYVVVLWRNNTPSPIMYFIIVILILMNEPFLSNSPIFWGCAFVSYDVCSISNTEEIL